MIVRHWRSVLMVCTAAALVLPVSQALAQSAPAATPATNADGATVLQKIVVKGNRAAPGSIADTPLATQIDRKELEQKQVTNYDDIGRSVDATVNYSRADGGFNLRGLSGPRILTTIDGIPIPYVSNSSRQGAFATSNANGGGDTFDFDSLSSLDIVRGADSSKGGSGMLGGAFVLNTLEPEDLIPEDRDWGAIVKSTYDSEDRSIAGSAAAAKKVGNTSILFQGSYRKGHERDNTGDNDSYGRLRTEADPADFDQNNLLFKVRQDLEGGHRIGLTAERFRRDLKTDLREQQGFGRTYMINNFDGRELRDRDRVSLDYDYEAQSSDAFFSSARATLYWLDLKKEAGSQGRTAANVAYGRNNEIENETWGFSGTATKDFEYSGLNHSVRVGLDVGVSKWTQFSWALCPTPTTCPSLNNQAEVPNVDSQNLALTFEDKIEIGNTGFALTPGFRFDWFNYNPSTGGGFATNTGLSRFGDLRDRTEAAMSPKLLATYDLTPDVQLYAQLAVGFRAPTVDELYSRFYNPNGRYAQLGNPDLEPEIGRGIEIGANFDTGGMQGRVAAFHTRYQNFIETQQNYNPVANFTEFNYVNVSSASISGLEANVIKTFDNGINLHTSLAYTYGRNDDTQERLRSVAPFKAIIGGGWSNDEYGFDLSSTLSSQMTGNDNAETSFDAPGYGIVDLTAWWTPEQVKGLRIQGGVYNIFDQEYYSALAVRDVNLSSPTASQPKEWYTEPGRTFKISVTKTF
ncbi:hemoglobin/transferrin/lactoferrin receptor protein [Rhizobium sp. BK275]|uniref:TonB-dependent hemoglobin/transferrin/lactoferrin family receptor n=1 Tax=Rhizobium sp. BK275 TaxID=2587077 RepID=UPI00161BF648|nr:TonB-dependent hemoglobin/transferrin/lactoferrin family receptor [Rhizobium sp. BK275]MBB3390217.1 hemoglobin/transferrin/lactoferrin receptor protein [Rhizobium sp. BK275]